MRQLCENEPCVQRCRGKCAFEFDTESPKYKKATKISFQSQVVFIVEGFVLCQFHS